MTERPLQLVLLSREEAESIAREHFGSCILHRSCAAAIMKAQKKIQELNPVVVRDLTADELAEPRNQEPVLHSEAVVSQIKENVPEFSSLEMSVSERKTLFYAAQGLRQKEIARLMNLSQYTIQDYAKSLIAKFGARSLAHCASLAFQQGILSKELLTVEGD